MAAAERTRLRVERLRKIERLIGLRAYGAIEFAEANGVARRTIERDLVFLKEEFNQISAKHVDFVVCARDSLRIVAAVELDDRSHDAPHRQRRDAFLERAFAVADVRLARVSVRAGYEVAAVRSVVLGNIAPKLPVVAREAGAVIEASGVRPYHACGSAMELRSVQRGADGVQEFYVCTNAPRCRVRYASRDASA